MVVQSCHHSGWRHGIHSHLLYTTKLQLELAYDLSRFCTNTPSTWTTLKTSTICSRLRSVSSCGGGPSWHRRPHGGVKHFVKSLQFLKALPVVGERNIVKFAIPVVAIPISAFMNHYSTGKIGQMARRVYRDKASIREISKQLAEEASASLLLLKTVFLVCVNLMGPLPLKKRGS